MCGQAIRKGINMLKEKTTWLLIIMILGVAFIGGLDHKKTAEVVSGGHSNQVDLYK